MKLSILVLPLLMVLLVISCAKQQPPPGGPEDKTSPEIVGCIPQNGSVEVDLDPEITVSFSESMNKSRIREAVFVSPPPDGELETSWKKNDLKISFTDSLAVDRTYLVTIGSNVTDAHNNRLKESFTIAFSTGSTLDSGSITGTVSANGASLIGATVVVHNLSDAESGAVLSQTPQYITQTGNDGTYTLGYISPGDYLLFAFDDRNNNRTWDPPKERVGLPSAPAIVHSQGSAVRWIDIDVIDRDTMALAVDDASITTNGVLKIKLSQKVLRHDIRNAEILLISDDSPPDTFWIVDKFAWEDSATNFVAVAPDVGKSEAVYLQIHNLIDLWGNLIQTEIDSILLQPPVTVDKTPPQVDEVDPAAGSRDLPLVPTILVRFDEPIKLITDTVGLSLRGPDSILVSTTSEQVDPFTVVFVPEDTLIQASKYQGDLNLSIVSDRSGNQLTDSILTIRFETVNRDSLGSFSGSVILERAVREQLPMLFYRLLPQGGWLPLEYDADGRFHHTTIPGSYCFFGFYDWDNDGYLTRGRLSPFEYAEPIILFEDTVSVRSRFETEDISLLIDKEER